LSTQEWFGPPVNRADIELYFKKYYTVFWNHYFKLQIPFLIRWKIIFGDLESWVIWANMGINQSLNLEKINKKLNVGIESSQNDRKNNYLYNVLETEPKQGVNVSSIADVSGIPRATVFRKLKKLSNDKIIKRNKKLEYILTNEGILNEEIQVNFLINQKCIALFVTDIFNLIKKSSLKI
jgi:predicted transcriptional regulator